MTNQFDAARSSAMVGDVALVDIVCALLQRETEPHILCGLLDLLERIDCVGYADAVAPLTRHGSAAVRKCATTAIAWTLGLDRVSDAHPAVQRLIEMTMDPDDDVRNWATFALGSQSFVDGPHVRRAFRARLDDAHKETRDEALHALAARRDRTIVNPVVAALRAEDVSSLPIHAAAHLADPVFVDTLNELSQEFEDDDEIQLALALCQSRQADLQRTIDQINAMMLAVEAESSPGGSALCFVTDLYQRQNNISPDVSIIVNDNWDHPDSLHRVWTSGDGTATGALALVSEMLGARGGS